ncbi:MAG TPA: crossover junction endodeoxyribonuclease RuvC [Pirellulaceae bacterium]|nr:crossover junction endodeoxyribonuclease RuvC [Pirellulaceae bacterium]
MTSSARHTSRASVATGSSGRFADGARIVGVDPGLNITGYGAVEVQGGKATLLEAGVLRPGSSKKPIERRLLELYDGLSEALTEIRPVAIAIEQLYSHYELPRTAILMGHARGVICLAAAKHDVPVFSYAPAQIKKTLTGGGRADKAQMQRAIAREFGLAQPPEPADVADALAIALCHFFLGGPGANEELDDDK